MALLVQFLVIYLMGFSLGSSLKVDQGDEESLAEGNSNGNYRAAINQEGRMRSWILNNRKKSSKDKISTPVLPGKKEDNQITVDLQQLFSADVLQALALLMPPGPPGPPGPKGEKGDPGSLTPELLTNLKASLKGEKGDPGCPIGSSSTPYPPSEGFLPLPLKDSMVSMTTEEGFMMTQPTDDAEVVESMTTLDYSSQTMIGDDQNPFYDPMEGVTDDPSDVSTSMDDVMSTTTTSKPSQSISSKLRLIACSATLPLRNATWESPEVFNPTSGTSCSLSIPLMNKNFDAQPICQIRLDFERFQLGQPDDQGACKSDHFEVLNAGNEVPIICGDNDGQHMYINTNTSAEKVDLQFKFGASGVESRGWSIKITILPCSSVTLAPDHCLQYHDAMHGVIKSFNYPDITIGNRDSDDAELIIPTRQLINQNYHICFRPIEASAMCLESCNGGNDDDSGTISTFSLSGLSNVRPLRAGAGTDQCTEDYLTIPNGFDVNDVSLRNDRYCGNAFNMMNEATQSGIVCTDVKPFGIHYKTDDKEIGSRGNNGFCLHFSIA